MPFNIANIVWNLLAQILLLINVLSPSTDFTNVEYLSESGRTVYAYLATPPGYDSENDVSYPTAVVLHAWNGMDDEPVYFADLLAEAGYIALAPDMFRGVAAPSLFIPWNIFTVSTYPQTNIDEDLNAALAYLGNDVAGVDTKRVVSGPGFCFGGSQALALSARVAMAATVSLYGSSISRSYQDPESNSWGLIGVDGAPVLGIYGSEDGAPSPEAALGFQAAMEARGIVHNVTIYDGVGHAFVNPTDHKAGEEQATAAWFEVIDFMTKVAEGSGVASKRLSTHDIRKTRESTFMFDLKWLLDHATDKMKHKGHFHPAAL